jgi:hypothetical protein
VGDGVIGTDGDGDSSFVMVRLVGGVVGVGHMVDSMGEREK